MKILIKNDLELSISEENLAHFLSTLEGLEKDESIQELSPRKQEIYRKALYGEVENLQIQIQEYNKLKNEGINAIIIKESTDLPQTIIKYRIAKGISESTLAKKLGIEESELIEHEENLFVDADKQLLKDLLNILNVEVPHTLSELLFNSEKVKSNLKTKLGSIFNRLVPFELKEEYNLLEGYLKLHSALQRIFGEQSNAILLGTQIDYRPVSVRYKVPNGLNSDTLYLHTSYAFHISKRITEINDIPSKTLETDPNKFRKAIIEKYGELNIENCIQYVWHLGIPVLPLKLKGGFHAACWRIDGRNVIVLKQQSKSNARWLFDLLHEYWHATQEPHLLSRDVVDIQDVMSEGNKNQEELDANNFAADVIFDGKLEELLNECVTLSNGKIQYLKRAVQSVATTNGIDVGALANQAAFHLQKSGRNWWGAAQNLQDKDDPFNIAYKILEESINISEIDDPIDKELLENALYEDVM